MVRATLRPKRARRVSMTLSDESYRSLRRLHALSGIVPVGVFLIIHFLTNAGAVLGPEPYNRVARALDSMPAVRAIEVVGIGLPLLAHVVLGAVLGNARQAVAEPSVYPRTWMLPVQRATGGLLVVYVLFHVWSTRFSEPVLKGDDDFFSLMQHHLQNPGVLAFYAAAVLAVSAHFGIGLFAVARRWNPAATLSPATARVAFATFVLLSVVGLNAVFAFVSRPARWLERASESVVLDHSRAASSPSVAPRQAP